MNDAFTRCLLDDILFDARKRGASDIHLARGKRPMLRVDGMLTEGTPISFDADAIHETFKRLASVEAERLLDMRGDTSFVCHSERWGRARFHWSRAQGDLMCSARLLPASIPDAESLGVPSRLCELAHSSSGLLAVVGPTGSGKSTTLASLVREIATRGSRKIVSIDDPVEFDLSSLDCSVEQRALGLDVESLDAAVLSALRSDPDIIVIGEVRSAHDMRSLLRATETGHLVLTTLHAGDAAAAIDRFLRCFAGDEGAMARAVLADVLIGICAQRLLPVPSGGRVLTSELLVATDAVRAIVRDGKSHQLRNAMTLGSHAGMVRFSGVAGE